MMALSYERRDPGMKPDRNQKIEILKIGAVVILMLSLMILPALILLRCLGDILSLFEGTRESVAPILSQLKEADIQTFVSVPVLLSLGGAWLRKKVKHGKLLTVCLILCGFIVCFLFSRVNGIRTCDLLLVLIRLLRNGLTEVL